MTHPHDQAPAPLTAEVVAMCAQLRRRGTTTCDSAADMLTALAAENAMLRASETALATQLAEREKELARVMEERDALAKAIDEYAPNPALMARIIMSNIARGCDLDTATARIATLTEALTEAADALGWAEAHLKDAGVQSANVTFGERDATAALTTDKGAAS